MPRLTANDLKPFEILQRHSGNELGGFGAILNRGYFERVGLF